MSSWGYIGPNTLPPILHYIEVPIVSKNDCNNTYMNITRGIKNTMICAGYINDNDDGKKFFAGVVFWVWAPTIWAPYSMSIRVNLVLSSNIILDITRYY